MDGDRFRLFVCFFFFREKQTTYCGNCKLVYQISRIKGIVFLINNLKADNV